MHVRVCVYVYVGRRRFECAPGEQLRKVICHPRGSVSPSTLPGRTPLQGGNKVRRRNLIISSLMTSFDPLDRKTVIRCCSYTQEVFDAGKPPPPPTYLPTSIATLPPTGWFTLLAQQQLLDAAIPISKLWQASKPVSHVI